MLIVPRSKMTVRAGTQDLSDCQLVIDFVFQDRMVRPAARLVDHIAYVRRTLDNLY